MEGHPERMPFLFLHEFHLAGNDVPVCYFLAGASPALPDADSSDNVDVRSGCQEVQIGDILTFPRGDVVPGGFYDLASVLRGVAVIGRNGEIGTFGVSENLHENAPDDATD